MKDVVLLQSPEQIKEVLEEGISMEYTEFVSSMLTRRYDSKHDFGNRDLTNYAAIIGEFPPLDLDLVSAFRVGGSIGHDILIRAVENWTIIASEEFPKSIARLPDADLEFQVRNRQQKKSIHCTVGQSTRFLPLHAGNLLPKGQVQILWIIFI